eukprot:g6291.t1
MDPNDDEHEASQQVTADAAAEVASLSCSISDGGSAACPASNDTSGVETHFQAELLGHVQTGHRGLETALQLLCKRLLDLEGCWERTEEEHRAKYWELQQECLDRQKHLSGLDDDMRQGLRNLEKKVEQLTLAQEPGVEEVAPSNGAAVPVQAVVAAVESVRADGRGDTKIREELRALKTKVDIIAANVLGATEGDGIDIGTTRPSPEVKELPHCNDDDCETRTSDVEAVEDIASNDVAANSIERRSPTDDEGEAMAEKNNPRKELEGAYRALGVNVYTKGSGRLDVLAREVRLSLNMVVEHQARAASDNLSAPLCLFPARAGDLSLISAAATIASPPEPVSSSSDTNGRNRTDSLEKRLSRILVSTEHFNSDRVVGENGDFARGGGGNGACGGGAGLTDRFGGDEGRLWMLEDGGYLCVDILLERTLEELAEGLAYAASRVEQERSRSTRGSRASVGRASASNAAGGVVGPTRKLLLASFTNEEDNEGSASKLKREIERMQDRCSRLGALVARLVAARQREQQAGGGEGGGDEDTGPEQLFTEAGEAERQRQNSVYSAGEESERDTPIPHSEAAAAVVNEVLRLSCALAGDLQYLLSQQVYCRVLESFSFTPGRKCLCGRDFDVHHGSTVPTYTPTATTAAAGGEDGAACGRLSGGDSVSAESGTGGCGPEHTHGFRVRPTLYHSFVFALGHLSGFLATARSRSSHRAVSSITGELKRDVLTAKLAAREAVAASAAAQKVARLASAEALEATARAASAAASARKEGSFLLEELHEQLARAMRAERDRMEQEKDERAKTERKKSQLLETQLGHLKALLDSKAGQEDLTSITKAMGDVEETLTVVRQSIPGQSALVELQEALSRKADKAYTKRKMALLVSRVSALLKEESDEPSMAKKCLSCDRAFNKPSFKELELAQQLPDVLESFEDTAVATSQQRQERQVVGGADSPGAGRQGDRVDWLEEPPADGVRTGSPGAPARQEAKRPGSAPSASLLAFGMPINALLYFYVPGEFTRRVPRSFGA